MATGVKPRDDETMLTRTDLEAIQEAMRSKKFRDMLAEYCDEVRDPANQALYQKEMTQLEKERGYDITFINPKGGYVIKTSVAGDRKAFINICSNDNIGKPSHTIENVDGQKGMNWKIPYSLIPPREDYDNKKQRCVIYDVVFHPDTLRMAKVNERFREIVNKTAFDGLQNTYNIHLDSNNCRFPKSSYKGMATSAVVRKEDPLYQPPTGEEVEELSPELLEKLYPQHTYTDHQNEPLKDDATKVHDKRKPLPEKKEFIHSTDKGYTIPKYVLKQQKNVDMQEYTFNKDCKQFSAIPSHLVVEINLPLIPSTKDCILDVNERSLTLISEKPAKYKLDLTLPYSVDDKCGNAKFDKSRHMLIVTLPVIKNEVLNENISKIDSGVESEENSGSQSEEDNYKEKLITEVGSILSVPDLKPPILEKEIVHEEPFLQGCIGYVLPPYTHNLLDDIIAFTFHVKNTEPDSVIVRSDGNVINIKFTSIGSGFVPVHHAAIIVFDKDIKFKDVSGEAWDNNVILQLELASDIPQTFQIGLSKDSMTTEHFDMSQFKKTPQDSLEQTSEVVNSPHEVEMPVVEVTNLGSETNIVVSSKNENEEFNIAKEKEIRWTDSGHCETGAKSILRKSISMMRSVSESSVGDVASSMDYISSDCIPEESSLKKTVRFNDVIARQFYRYNSSIEGQKKKNQRKKSKKRNQERRKSESEAEEEFTNSIQTSKPRLKSALKLRRDSGLADTSDAENECRNLQSDSELSCDSNIYYEKKMENVFNVDSEGNSTSKTIDRNGNTITKLEARQIQWKSKNDSATNKKEMNPVTCDNIKHNTEFYNPENLNKGQYQEVMFKNDLIFDLDM